METFHSNNLSIQFPCKKYRAITFALINSDFVIGCKVNGWAYLKKENLQNLKSKFFLKIYPGKKQIKRNSSLAFPKNNNNSFYTKA